MTKREAADYIRETYDQWTWSRTDDGEFMRVQVPDYPVEQRISTEALFVLEDVSDEEAREAIDYLIDRSVDTPAEDTPEVRYASEDTSFDG